MTADDSARGAAPDGAGDDAEFDRLHAMLDTRYSACMTREGEEFVFAYGARQRARAEAAETAHAGSEYRNDRQAEALNRVVSELDDERAAREAAERDMAVSRTWSARWKQLAVIADDRLRRVLASDDEAREAAERALESADALADAASRFESVLSEYCDGRERDDLIDALEAYRSERLSAGAGGTIPRDPCPTGIPAGPGEGGDAG